MSRAGPTPSPTGTGTRHQRARGGGVTPQSWAESLLQALGMPVTKANVQSIVSWEAMEGGNWNNTATYNPLNTSQAEPGSAPMNAVGVQAYDSWTTGLQATVATLHNGQYNDVLAALKSGKGLFGKHLEGLADWSGYSGVPGQGGYDSIAPHTGYAGGPGTTIGQIQTTAADPASCAVQLPSVHWAVIFNLGPTIGGGCLLSKSQVRAMLAVGNLILGAGLLTVGAGYVLGSTRPARMILNVAAFAVPGGKVPATIAATEQAGQASRKAAQAAPEPGQVEPGADPPAVGA